MNFNSLVGITFTSVEQIGDEKIVFVCDNGKTYNMYHRSQPRLLWTFAGTEVLTDITAKV